ncbi:MAG: glycosyltransferase family 4 protein, partial [bacterium]|nr:glycosyltransferase family 4 protein [bacterium]
RPGYRNPNAWGRRATAWVEYVFHHTILNVYRRNIDCIIAPSRFVADAVRGWGWRGKIEVIPNFLPSPPRSLRTPSNSPSGRGGETPPVLFVGRLSEEKGIADFVEAARRLPEIPFEVVGNGNSSSPPLTLRGGNIRWLGVLQPDEAQRRIASAAVVVVPSVVPEIAPYVILEAMAAGVPVVASRIGGIPELVHEGETGFLVPPRDPAALAKTIEMVYGDGMLRERLGTRARAIATAEYGPERHYERIIGLFTALCTTRGS